jgi:hypothetical protein
MPVAGGRWSVAGGRWPVKGNTPGAVFTGTRHPLVVEVEPG